MEKCLLNVLQNGTGSAIPEIRKSIVACYLLNARVETEANLAHLIGKGSCILHRIWQICDRRCGSTVIFTSSSSIIRELDICLSLHKKKIKIELD